MSTYSGPCGEFWQTLENAARDVVGAYLRWRLGDLLWRECDAVAWEEFAETQRSGC